MWSVERIAGDAGEVHARIPDEDLGPAVWVIDVTATALVLGSSQSATDVDTAACDAAGVRIARRRSGGGAVLLVPGDVLWLDVILPATHVDWDHDVVRSGWWLGDRWAEALADVGVTDTHVHHGPLLSNRWSSTVCFAGTGPGEVSVAGRKLVGISQRRTRTHARFQCALHHVWRPELLATLVRPPEGATRPADELRDLVATSDVDDSVLVAALVDRLERHRRSG